jgi:hypothetical protein
MPPLFVDGIEIKELFVDSVERDTLFVDGVQVFQKGLENIEVTQGTGSAGFAEYWGFNNLPEYIFTLPQIGSRSPTTLDGASIAMLAFAHAEFPSPVDFLLVYLRGNRAQNFFTSVEFEDASVELSANADAFSYQATEDFTLWQWNDITIPALWDGSGLANVDFIV